MVVIFCGRDKGAVIKDANRLDFLVDRRRTFPASPVSFGEFRASEQRKHGTISRVNNNLIANEISI